MADQVVFIQGKGGFPCIQISNAKASALISLYAGQVLSYQPVDEAEDMMFVSDNAHFQQGKAIKGGIPICWPWFGSHPENTSYPAHGFVRDNDWQVLEIISLDNGDTQITLEFKPTEKSQVLWPNSFQLTLEIVIGDSLNIILKTRNTGDQAFSMSEALHTYFKVGEASKIQILGLDNLDYLDKTTGFEKKHQSGSIKISEETDRVYLDTKKEVIIDDPCLKRQIVIKSSGHQNVVVWNPWQDASNKMADLTNHDYNSFVCVEMANALANCVEVLSGDTHILETNYSIRCIQ